MSSNSFITVVSGLPRSGTSLMMQMLVAGGLPALTDNVRPADENNPRGYLEFEAVKRLRTEQNWIEQARGRAVKVIHLLVRELPVDGRFQYRVILMQRPIAEVLASQRTMLARDGKPSADAAMLEKVYTSQLDQLQGWLSQQPSFAVLPVRYPDLIEQPRPSVDRINEFLGGSLDPEAMVKAVDATLYRQRSAG